MKSTLIVAHRGLSSLYPENTLISFNPTLTVESHFSHKKQQLKWSTDAKMRGAKIFKFL